MRTILFLTDLLLIISIACILWGVYLKGKEDAHKPTKDKESL